MRHAQRTVSGSQRSAGPAAVGDAERGGDAALVAGRDGRRGPSASALRRPALERRAPPPSRRGTARGCGARAAWRAARRSRSSRRTSAPAVLLALADRRDRAGPRVHIRSRSVADQVGVLGEALDEDRPRAVQRRGDVGDALLGVDERGGGRRRVERRVGEQRVGERLQPGLAGDLRLGAALRLVRQVDVLEPGLGVGAPMICAASASSSLPCSRDRLEDRRRGAPRARAGSAAAPRACAAGRRRGVPVTSLRYRAMNGTVAPPSSRSTAASTCRSPHGEFLGDPSCDRDGHRVVGLDAHRSVPPWLRLVGQDSDARAARRSAELTRGWWCPRG